MRPSKYTRDVLAPIVARARSLSAVLRALGLPTTGGNHRMIAARIRQAELDTSHFAYGRTSELRLAAVSNEELAAIVRACRSVAQVCQRLGLPDEGRPHHDLAARIRKLGIETSHFRGQGWSRGETSRSHLSVASGAKRRSFRDEEVFVANSPIIEGRSIRRRLLAMGLLYQCAWCGLAEWRGQPIVLHLDHINGINNDNRIANVRLLCPNCHSQTPTFCNRRR